jgi:CMP-N-acetylneuraminic acid synthetase
MTKRLVIIPAREGSKRIKFKNIKKLLGKPLIQYSLDACLKSKLFNKIHISSDSKKILNLAKKNNLNVSFYRPKKLSGDKIPINKVVINVLEEFKKRGEIFDEAWLVYATNPMINEKILKTFSKKFNLMRIKNDHRILIAVNEYNHPIEKAQRLTKKNSLKPIFNNKFKEDSQKLQKSYCDAGMISVYPMIKFLKNKSLEFTPLVLPKNQSIDINDLNDFNFAKKMISKLKT